MARLGVITYHQERVTRLAEPPFCFSCKRFPMFCEGMYEKLAQSPRIAQVGE